MTFSSKELFSKKQLTRSIGYTLWKYGHNPKYEKIKYYTPSDYKSITGTIITPEQILAVPNGLQKTIYDAFQKLKPDVGDTNCSLKEEK